MNTVHNTTKDENKQILKEISRICHDVFQTEQGNVNDRLNVDCMDIGYEILNDNEIIKQVTKKDMNNE